MRVTESEKFDDKSGCGECEMPAYDQHHNREVGVAFYITSVTQNRSM